MEPGHPHQRTAVDKKYQDRKEELKILNDIRTWILLLAAVLQLAACRSGDDGEEAVGPADDCYLSIYVYAPGHPIVTRANEGDVKATDEESKVNTLKIWVFRHIAEDDAPAVAYLDTIPTFLNQSAVGQQTFKMLLSKDFADAPGDVDVYVVANEASYTSGTLDRSSTRNDLDGAMIDEAYFGPSTRFCKVPESGLPMSAVLRNQPVSGKFPTLHIGPENDIATVQLTRAVSKLRFVLCRLSGQAATPIYHITLDGNQIPTASYLVPPPLVESNTYYRYAEKAISYNDIPTEIQEDTDPSQYVYEKWKENNPAGTAQDYEEALSDLTQFGLTYLRESDKQLQGTIYLEDAKDGPGVPFQMAAEGDFLRNHSWTVYIYYMNGQIYTSTVSNIGMQQWGDGSDKDHSIYNW